MKDYNDIRITIYCNSEEQKEKIISKIKNVQAKNNYKKMGAAVEKICDAYNVYDCM